jgi:hypothetical protein
MSDQDYLEQDPFEISAEIEEVDTELEEPQKTRGRPVGRKSGARVSRDVRIAVQVVTASKDIQILLGKLVDCTPDDKPLVLVAAALRHIESIDAAINWLVRESEKTDGMEIALDVSNLYASDLELYRGVVDLLSNAGVIAPVRKSDLGKILLPCAQAIHSMKKTDTAAFQQIQEVLS